MATAATGPTRKDTQRVTLTVNGHDCGIWDTRTGGKKTSEQLKTKTGGMGEVALGGSPSTETLTLSRLYEVQRDHVLLGALLLPLVGKGRCTALQDAVDLDGNPSLKPLRWTGILSSYMPPDYDVNSNDRADVTIEITCDAGSPTY